GWADLRLRVGSESFTVEWVSYSTDVIGDLLRLALVITTGAYTASVYYDHEPSVSRLTCSVVGDVVTLHVFELDDAEAMVRNEQGTMVFFVDCDRDELAAAILSMARKFLASDSDTATWGGRYEYPARALDALEFVLSSRDKKN